MNILITGGSSFSGYWFIRELTRAGHEVWATFRGNLENYAGVRRQRVERVLSFCRPLFRCEFGGQDFLEILKDMPNIGLFCHHAADVTNYKEPSFDFVGALENNTKGLNTVIKVLKEKGCNKILLTGSAFEQNEGIGSDGLRAFSPYGLSKGLTYEVFRYFAEINQMKLGKFVIPNPFGPFEEPRFTSFLIRKWFAGETPTVATPAYVRDNIHVSVLAKAYVYFADGLDSKPGLEKLNPSGYPESQGAFALRFAREMRERLGLPCELELAEQKDFAEPKVRINYDLLDPHILNWQEKEAWDQLAYYYAENYGPFKK
jgi:UDP-glucose 4-epimerase